jgi:subtilisin family serine protease
MFETAAEASVSRESVQADPARADKALRKSLDRGLPARITNKARVEIEADASVVQEMFKVELREETKRPESQLGLELFESFTTSAEALTVPDDLQNEIAYAYLPTPPTFFASPIPPKLELHHLTLDTMQAVVGAGQCHRRGWTGQNIVVAMVDTGFAHHPHFQTRGHNYLPTATPQQPDPTTDTNGHGTGECANIFAIAPNIEFLGIRNGGSSAEDLESALDTPARILTNSWGWSADTQSWGALQASNPNLFFEFQDISALIADGIADGKIFVFSAGNGHFAFPGSHPDVISAGGVTVNQDASLQASSYASSFASQLYPGRSVPDLCGVVGEATASPMPGHIMLPVPDGASLEGENMPASVNPDGWGIFSGTSAAAPQLAGVLALMQHARASVNRPPLTAANARTILQAAATDVTVGHSAMGDPAGLGPDLATGAGFVDAFGACVAATNL